MDDKGQTPPVGGDGEQLETVFLSEYDHTLDNKGRVNIPSSYRRIFERKDIRMVFAVNVIDEGDAYIRVYPPEYFRKQTLAQLRQDERKSRRIDAKARRQLARMCTPIPIDRQGRITLSPKMCKRAKINKDVRFVGALDYFEIWGLEEFRRAHGED